MDAHQWIMFNDVHYTCQSMAYIIDMVVYGRTKILLVGSFSVVLGSHSLTHNHKIQQPTVSAY
jgi:hypothetical protein